MSQHPAQRRYVRFSILLGFLYACAAPVPLVFGLDLPWNYFSIACVALGTLSFLSARHPEDRALWFAHGLAKLAGTLLLGAYVATHEFSWIPTILAGAEALGFVLVFFLGVLGTGRKRLPGIPPEAPMGGATTSAG